MTADQYLRFWALTEAKPPSFKFHCKHPADDSLTAVAVTKDNNTLVTGDTSGQLKMWDISEVDLDNQATEGKFLERYFIIAHKAMINSIQLVEHDNIHSDSFIITASNDNNINLHRLSNGVFVGQFGQAKAWNIHDMSPYEGRKPRYVREWYLKLKAKMKTNKDKKANEEQKAKELAEGQVAAAKGGAMANAADDNGAPVSSEESEGERPGREQSEYEDMLADQIDFTDEEDVEEEGGITIKNAAASLRYQPPKKHGRGGNNVDWTKYYEAIESHAPDIRRGELLVKKKTALIREFKKK